MQMTVRMERYADQGRCVAHVDGRVVFVRFALPGELVRIELDEPCDRTDRFWTGEVVEVLDANEHRVSPPWALAGPLSQGGGVGGADLIHVDLPGQLAWKSAVVHEQMARLGHCELDDLTVGRMAGDDALAGLHWRTRIEMIADEHGRVSMHRRGTHVRVPIDDMPLASRALLAVAKREGVWERTFAAGAQIRIAVPQPRHMDDIAADDETLLRAVGDNYAVLVDGVLDSGNARLHECVPYDGVDYHYEVAAKGFWQMHRQAPLALCGAVMDAVREATAGNDAPVLWDLYSGSGLFTVPMACATAPHSRVFAVEGAQPAVSAARRTVQAMGVDGRVHLHCGDVSASLRQVPQALSNPDVVVLDPPRAGAKAQVCRQIARSGAPVVVYVACDVASVARDTATLMSLGYQTPAVRAFDVYPMTHHVEVVAVFRRERSQAGAR